MVAGGGVGWLAPLSCLDQSEDLGQGSLFPISPENPRLCLPIDASRGESVSVTFSRSGLALRKCVSSGALGTRKQVHVQSAHVCILPAGTSRRGEVSGSDGVFQRRSEGRHGEVAEQQEAGLPAAAHGDG